MTDVVDAEREQTQALSRHTQAREQIRELGMLYHPYDLASGAAQSLAHIHLAKAQRLTVQWLATPAFFWGTV